MNRTRLLKFAFVLAVTAPSALSARADYRNAMDPNSEDWGPLHGQGCLISVPDIDQATKDYHTAPIIELMLKWRDENGRILNSEIRVVKFHYEVTVIPCEGLFSCLAHGAESIVADIDNGQDQSEVERAFAKIYNRVAQAKKCDALAVGDEAGNKVSGNTVPVSNPLPVDESNKDQQSPKQAATLL